VTQWLSVRSIEAADEQRAAYDCRAMSRRPLVLDRDVALSAVGPANRATCTQPSQRSRRGPVMVSADDLWVTGKEVARFDLPPLTAHLRCPSPDDLSGVPLEAMSADTQLTSNARTGLAVTREPGSDLRLLL